ncbi:hypothetical protein A2U01_0113949, partial [Trifolium medium]|nr:hypothetical protein [Trifolium medium]
GSVGEE